jgi:hypothetical protein
MRTTPLFSAIVAATSILAGLPPRATSAATSVARGFSHRSIESAVIGLPALA